MNMWKSPIRVLLIYLCVLGVWASFNWGGLNFTFWVSQLAHFMLLLAPGWLLYTAFLRKSLVKPTRWEHRLITVLILFLLFDPLFPWWVFLAAGLITELVQRFVRLPTGPVANPAAVGALLLSLTGQYPTWWGVNFGPRFTALPGQMTLLMALTTLIAGYVAWKYHKLAIVSAAAVSFSVFYLMIFRSSPLAILLDGTLAFFLLVMAVEPKTSPAIQNQQYVYGAVIGAGVVALLAAAYRSLSIEAYTASLIFTNVIFNLYKNKMFLQNTFKKTLPPPTPSTTV
jgi:hypothetical protein